MIIGLGSPILHTKTPEHSAVEINSDEVQRFIGLLMESIKSKEYGIGLAAPQINKSVQIAVINIKLTNV